MSTYHAITRHPRTGEWFKAEWKDDYFGDHLYGVKFPDDPVVYPAAQVLEHDIKTFWAQDVRDAFKAFMTDLPLVAHHDIEEETLTFLRYLQDAYKARWERDPEGGEGAVNWLREMRGGDAEDL